MFGKKLKLVALILVVLGSPGNLTSSSVFIAAVVSAGRVEEMMTF